MCGIAGYAGFLEPGLVERMCATLRHRGPDSDGIVVLPDERMALGIRRLAVIDLSTGNQPMAAEAGHVQLVFNGEIYNYRELRNDLRRLGRAFDTASDTEVVLQAYLQWGSAAWTKLHGMFAVAIADRRGPEPVLRIVRDRVGIKPLYYVSAGGSLVFASELKALLHWSRLERAVDLSAISTYLRLRYVPGPESLLSSVKKLPPGHELEFRAGTVKIGRWWSPPPAHKQIVGRDDREVVAEFGEALRKAVHRHMVSDVPVGAFLSGGINSNVIVALMAEVSSGPVRTFSISFPGQPDDDPRRAALTASAVGARHTAIECRSEDFAALPDIAWALDEPVGDPIVVPMYVLSREARKEVTVVLSGEGADEILGGYLFHRKILDLDRLRLRIPRFVWPLAAGLVGRIPSAWLDRAFDYPGRLGTEGRRKIAHMLRSTGAGGLDDLYRDSISLFDPDDVERASGGRLPPCSHAVDLPDAGTPLQRLLALQFADWLPDDILMKADKMSMAHSLECRVPFMDELVINAAARGADATKIRDRVNKWVLRRFGLGLVPAEVANAPKRAFYAPLEPYRRSGPLAELMRHALDPARIARRGLFNSAYVARLAAAGPGQGFLPEKRLFSILMLELWFERFAPDASWA